jgi:hypothetical protein
VGQAAFRRFFFARIIYSTRVYTTWQLISVLRRNGDTIMTRVTAKEMNAYKSPGLHEPNVSIAHAGIEDGHAREHALNWREINRVLFVSAAAGAIWFLGGAPNPYLTTIGVICTVVGGFPIFSRVFDRGSRDS